MDQAAAKQRQGTERRQYWRSHVEQWRGSGLTQKEYCRTQGICLERFGYWKRRLEREGQSGAFVAVPSGVLSRALCPSHSALRLTVDERYRIEIPEGFCPSTLKTVLEVLAHL